MCYYLLLSKWRRKVIKTTSNSQFLKCLQLINFDKMSLPATFVEGFHDLEKVKKIKYVDFGKTGLKVSNLAFGGGAFGNHYG